MSVSTPTKTVKEDLLQDDSRRIRGDRTAEVASLEITKCIKFQKFRYADEKRPGKKYQEKDFVTLKLNNVEDNVVRVVIMCIDADNPELVHPNGLIGANCENGIYDKTYAVTKRVFNIVIPYVRIERTKTKKTAIKEIKEIMDKRVSVLPSPYRERCSSQCSHWAKSPKLKFNTTKVRLAVFVTLEDDTRHLNGTLHEASNVICNCSEKTTLEIHKLSSNSVPALTGSLIDIFTTENGPGIEPDNYFLQVCYESDVHQMNWKSEKYWLEESDILYKRVITYRVPPFEPEPDLVYPVTVTLHLQCPTSSLHCTHTFKYVPQPDNQITAETSDNQDDIQNHEAQKLDMSFGTNQSSNEITTNGNDESLQIFKPIHVHNPSMVQFKGSFLQQENNSTNVASEVSNDAYNRPIYICTLNESGVKQMDASELGCLYAPTLAEKEHMGTFPSNYKQDEQNKLILPEERCLQITADGYNPAQITQLVTTSEKSFSVTKSDQIVDEQLRVQELPSSIANRNNRIQNADNKDEVQYIIFDVNNIRETSDYPATNLHDSKYATLRMVPLAQKIPTCEMVTSPWQVGECDASVADSNHAVKKLKLSK